MTPSGDDLRRALAAERQRLASEPGRSVWLSANAGSGKTRVLIERVSRLLLAGADAGSILCLTYTRAAAAEMEQRLLHRLGAWTMLPDDRLAAELAQIGVADLAGQRDLGWARSLFARAIETPGGLRIMTIHSFCTTLLRRFPLEAGVVPSFRALDDRAADRLRRDVLADLAAGPQVDVIDQLARQMTDDGFQAMVRAVVGLRGALAPDGSTNAGADATSLDRALGLGPDAERTVRLPLTDPAWLAAIRDLQALAATSESPTDRDLADALALALEADPSSRDSVVGLEGRFLTKADAKSGAFAAKIGKVPTKRLRSLDPALAARVDDLMRHLEQARPLRLALDARDRNLRLRAFADAFLTAYAQRKSDGGWLDFDDLITRTTDLLSRSDMAQWVLWRLDSGLSHLLVDEAQDTSREQWSVIAALAREFTAGQGARPERQRSLFVVGDPKQSIYSFQGADAASFERMRQQLSDDLAAIDSPLLDTDLAHSFRSSPAILSLVDEVFAAAEPSLGAPSSHVPVRSDHPGHVELWPLAPPTGRDEGREHWVDTDDRVAADDPRVLLAQRTVDAVVDLLDRGTVPDLSPSGSGFRRVRPGDILILLRNRTGVFYRALLQALKSRHIPMAGADQLDLSESLGVRDLDAVLRVLDLPQDDLSLAAALRSPLFGWSEADLYRLAQPQRPRGGLWTAMMRGDTGAEPGLRQQTLAIWRDLRAQVDFLRPFELLSRLLTVHDGRRRLVARLGPDTDDAIDAMLSQALAYEAQGIPSLSGYLDWRRSDGGVIKRQIDSHGGLLRVMTIHGAKGLEAPVVILPHAGPANVKTPGPILGGDTGALWVAQGSGVPAIDTRMQEAQAAQLAEEQRLLYVALTRAQSRLIIGGVAPARASRTLGPNWHAAVAAAMTRLGAVTHDDGRLTLSHAWDHAATTETAPVPPVAPDEAAGPAADRDLLPLTSDQQAGGAALVRLATSLGGAKRLIRRTPSLDYGTADPGLAPQPGGSPTADLAGPDVGNDVGERARARGTLLHRALELRLDPARLRSVLQAMAEASVVTRDEIAEIVTEAMALKARPDLAALFSDGALTEVTVSGVLPGLGPTLGQIDLLRVTPDRVLVVDYKTNRVVPSGPDEVPDGLLRQIAAYAALVASAYPGRTVDAAILWTATASLMPIPAQHLAAALERAAARVPG